MNQLIETARKNRVLSIETELDGIKRFAILDTGSNVSMIDTSLLKNIENIRPKPEVYLTAGNNTIIKQVGMLDVMIKINNFSYLVNAYVIKGLCCKLILGNDFMITNKMIINFHDKQINLTVDNNIVKMDDIWYNYINKQYFTYFCHNNINKNSKYYLC